MFCPRKGQLIKAESPLHIWNVSVGNVSGE